MSQWPGHGHPRLTDECERLAVWTNLTEELLYISKNCWKSAGYDEKRHQNAQLIADCKGSVMLQEMFCGEILGNGIHVDITLTHDTYLNIVAY